jgi:hypothetical protein
MWVFAAEGGTAVGHFGFVKYTEAMDMNLQISRFNVMEK